MDLGHSFTNTTSWLFPPEGSRLKASLDRVRTRLWLYGLMAVVIGVYAFFASAGKAEWPEYGDFHDLLADGFRAGHLSVLLKPAKELLEAKNPYDPVNSQHWVFDLTFYHGKYYLYWGPVPALFQALVKSAFGIHRHIGDKYAGYAFACLAFCAAALIVERIARRLFVRVPRGLVVLCVFVVALSNPILHLMTSLGTYQTAILSGQAWLLVGALAAFDAVWHADHEGARWWRYVVAGAAWGLALASRANVAVPIAIMIVATAVLASWGSERRWRAICARGFMLGTPVVLTGCALLFYNKLRFDSWSEFGLKLQLSGFPFRLSNVYWPANLYSYTLRPFVTSCQFPWLYQVWNMGPVAFPDGFKLPADYLIMEPVVGWLRTLPLSWLIPCALLLAPTSFRLKTRESRTYVWCLVAFSALAATTGLVSMGVYSATMRYLGDVIYGLTLISVMGAFALTTHRFGRMIPIFTSGSVAVLSLLSIVFGVLLGYQGYKGHFHSFNPELDAKLVKALSFCGDMPPEIPHYQP